MLAFQPRSCQTSQIRHASKFTLPSSKLLVEDIELLDDQAIGVRRRNTIVIDQLVPSGEDCDDSTCGLSIAVPQKLLNGSSGDLLQYLILGRRYVIQGLECG